MAVGVFGYRGVAPNLEAAGPRKLDARRLGVDVNAYWDRLNLLAGYLHGRDELLEGAAVRKVSLDTCHDATGPGGRGTMMGGVIPSLQSFPHDYSLDAVYHQVAYGSSGMMGMMGGGQRMPAFPYFTPEEIAAAYFYLDKYPPTP